MITGGTKMPNDQMSAILTSSRMLNRLAARSIDQDMGGVTKAETL
jgi:hypothetical protein